MKRLSSGMSKMVLKIEAPKWVTETEFTVTEDHIKLLKRAMVSWDDRFNQGPCIDPLQPYGSTCINCDVAEILDFKPWLDRETGKPYYTAPQLARMSKVHRETQIALSIFLKTGMMLAGTYEHSGLYDWKKVDDAL